MEIPLSFNTFCPEILDIDIRYEEPIEKDQSITSGFCKFMG